MVSFREIVCSPAPSGLCGSLRKLLRVERDRDDRSYEILLAHCLLNSRLKVRMCFREKVEQKGGLEMNLEMRTQKLLTWL